MKISNLNSGYFYGLLNEANVLNIQKQFEYGREPDPMSGESRESWSIEGYLENYIELLGSDETKAAFAKKLRKLLSNDERFLAHVREFEKGMPAWAEKAIGVAAIGAMAEKEELFGKGLILTVIPETIVIFGLVIAILIIGLAG